MKTIAMTYDRLKQIAHSAIDEKLTVDKDKNGNIAIYNEAFTILIRHNKFGELKLNVDCNSSDPKKLKHLADVIELASQYISSNGTYLTPKQKFLLNIKPKAFQGGVILEIKDKYYLEALLQKGDTAPVYGFIDMFTGRAIARGKSSRQAILELWDKLHDPDLEGPDRTWSDIEELLNEVYEES